MSLSRLLAMAPVAATLWIPASINAQVSDEPSQAAATSGSDASEPQLTVDTVESSLAEIEKNSELNEEQKAKLRTEYKQVSEVLQQAQDFATKAATFKASLESAPQNTVQHREQQKKLPTVEEAGRVDVEGGSEDVRKERDAQQAALKGLSDELARITGELLKTEGRPVEIGVRLPLAQSELSTIRNRWEAVDPTQPATSPSAESERFLLQAEYTRLLNEIEMMQQEQLSQSLREEELESQRDLLARQVENAKAAFEALQGMLSKELTSDVDRIRALAQQVSEGLPDDTAVQSLADEVRSLAEEFESVVKHLKQVVPAAREVKDRLGEVTDEYRIVRNEMNLGSGGQEVTQVLQELARRARPNALKLQVPISVERARLDWFVIKKKRRGQVQVESQFADQSSEAVHQLVKARLEILDKLAEESANLTKALAALQTDKQQYFADCNEVQTYVSEKLFGFDFRSCPPVGLATLTEIPIGLTRLFTAENGKELGAVYSLKPFVSLPILLLAVALLLARPRWIAALKATGPPTRKISTDRYYWTAEALLWTLLLTAPIPIVVGLTVWTLHQLPDPSDWIVGIAGGLEYIAVIVAVAIFVCEVCRPQGLGIVHFRWNADDAARVSRAVKSIAAAYVPMMIIVSSYTFGQASDYFDSVSRTAFILVHGWIMLVLWRLLYRKVDAVASQKSNPSSRFNRIWKSIRLPLLIGAPLVLIALACIGYVMTAVEFSFGLCVSAGILAMGRIFDDMTFRYYRIRYRRLALEEALAERKARLAAAAEERPQQETDELLQLVEEEELGLNLNAAGEQTVAFLHLFFDVVIVALLYGYWSSVIPLTATLDTITISLAGGLSLLTLVKSILVGIVSLVAVRNLPGILELSVFRTSTVEAGTRQAIYRLCQYAVIGIALISLSNVLKLDWAKLGWMAAALSVGLGFGLQEVVANFVSGLIVLFERPIRVGDVVTIEGTTGTVTNINMRATTITNWDRQDFVVPNKSLITGNILNWTLRASVNRIVIPVGVAYGTDTERAREILLAVAAEHPLVLDEPKPSASFEQFADSSLNLTLRAFLPNLDNRLGTLTELHTEIAKRFEAAGIEIPFPQQDLNLRTGWDPVGPANRPAASALDAGKPHLHN